MKTELNIESSDIYAEYRKLTGKKVVFIFLLFGLLLFTAFVGITKGALSIGMFDAIKAIFKDSGTAHEIVWKLRLPRVVIAILVGSGLGFAGTVFQAVLKNPLASPYTLGIASGAGFGAVVAILFGSGIAGEYLVPGAAFSFALLSSFFILGISGLKGPSSETMILAGIATMFLFSSLTSFLQYMGTMEQVHEIVFWFFGSLSRAGWKEVGLSGLMVLLPFPFVMKMSWDFNLLAAGDEAAKALGVNVKRIKITSIILASLITAGVICFTGIIGFIGLVAPHICRMLIGNDHRFLLPASALTGAVVVLAADILGRTLWAPQVIPIGIMTSFIGVPFFFYLLMKKTREYW